MRNQYTKFLKPQAQDPLKRSNAHKTMNEQERRISKSPIITDENCSLAWNSRPNLQNMQFSYDTSKSREFTSSVVSPNSLKNSDKQVLSSHGLIHMLRKSQEKYLDNSSPKFKSQENQSTLQKRVLNSYNSQASKSKSTASSLYSLKAKENGMPSREGYEIAQKHDQPVDKNTATNRYISRALDRNCYINGRRNQEEVISKSTEKRELYNSKSLNRHSLEAESFKNSIIKRKKSSVLSHVKSQDQKLKGSISSILQEKKASYDHEERNDLSSKSSRSKLSGAPQKEDKITFPEKTLTNGNQFIHSKLEQRRIISSGFSRKDDKSLDNTNYTKNRSKLGVELSLDQQCLNLAKSFDFNRLLPQVEQDSLYVKFVDTPSFDNKTRKESFFADDLSALNSASNAAPFELKNVLNDDHFSTQRALEKSFNAFSSISLREEQVQAEDLYYNSKAQNSGTNMKEAISSDDHLSSQWSERNDKAVPKPDSKSCFVNRLELKTFTADRDLIEDVFKRNYPNTTKHMSQKEDVTLPNVQRQSVDYSGVKVNTTIIKAESKGDLRFSYDLSESSNISHDLQKPKFLIKENLSSVRENFKGAEHGSMKMNGLYKKDLDTSKQITSEATRQTMTDCSFSPLNKQKGGSEKSSQDDEKGGDINVRLKDLYLRMKQEIKRNQAEKLNWMIEKEQLLNQIKGLETKISVLEGAHYGQIV